MRSFAFLFCLLATAAVAQTNTPPPLTNTAPQGSQIFNAHNLAGPQVYSEDPSVDVAYVGLAK